MNTPSDSPLGKSSLYSETYSPNILFPIPREKQRDSLGITGALPFYGVDVWGAYEVSWLNLKGKPMVSSAIFSIPASSPNLIESKSLKLYLNSLNQTQFQNEKTIRDLIQTDLSAIAKSPVSVCFYNEDDVVKRGFSKLPGTLLDTQDIACDTYTPTPSFLSTSKKEVNETLVSHLLKSNCPVTGQPDWASLSVSYSGNQIDKAGLLKYIVSYRHHQDFHEHCVEQIFLDIQAQCAPSVLTVFARFTRRGGLDINPYRSSAPLNNIDPIQLFRQ